MPNPKSSLQRDFTFIKKFVAGELFTGIAHDLIEEALPQEKKQQFNNHINEMFFLAGDMADAYQYMPFTVPEAFNPYRRSNRTLQSVPLNAEKEQAIIHKYKEIVDFMKEAVEDPALAGQTAVKKLMKNHIDLGERFIDGRNVDQERLFTPGKRWLLDSLAVDMVKEYSVPGSQEKKKITNEEFKKIYDDLHYEEFNDITCRHMDLMNELQNKTVTPARRAEITEELKSLNNKIIAEGERLLGPEIGDNVKNAFTSYEVNVAGARGVQASVINPAKEQLKLLECGWDPAYMVDMPIMRDVQNELVDLSTLINNHNITPLQGLLPKIQKIKSLDPTKKVFDSQTDFINYSQQYSDAMNDFLTEFKKPEVRKVFNEIADKITKNQVKPEPDPLPYGITEKEVNDYHPERYEVHSESHVYDAMILHDIAFLADKTNFRAKGITVDEYGSVKYSTEPGDKMIEAAGKLKTAADKILIGVNEFQERIEQEHIRQERLGQQEIEIEEKPLFNKLSDTINTFMETNYSGYLNYTDVTRGLNNIIQKAEDFENSDKRNTSREQRSIAKDIKKFAVDSLKEMKNLKPDNLYEAKPFNIIIEDIKSSREIDKNFASYAEKSPSARDVDYAGITGMAAALVQNPAFMFSLQRDLGEEVVSNKMIANLFTIYSNKKHFATGVAYNKNSIPNIFATSINTTSADNKVIADKPEVIEEAKQNFQTLDRDFKSISRALEGKNYPGMSSFINFQSEMAHREARGMHDYQYITSIPGGSLMRGLGDWKLPPEKNQDPKAFDDMLIGMKYDKLYEEMLKRVDLKKELKNSTLTPEKRREYADKLKASNNAMIEIYEHMRSDKCREKYQGYFQNYNDTVKGVRGVHNQIADLEKRNKALENGWDPARIDDIVPIEKFTKQSEDFGKMFGEIKDPRLNKLEALNNTMVSLSPENKKFKNQWDYDLYNLRLANTAKAMLEESKKPEVRQALTDAMKKCDDEKEAYKQYNDLRRNEGLAHRKDPTVAVRPEKPEPMLTSPGISNMLNILTGKDVSKSAEFRQFIKEMDITKQRFKGTAEEIANRENGIKAAQKYRDLTNVSETVNIIAANAAKKVERMERDLDGMKYPSKEYTEMKLALINVAQLSKGENSISSSLEALDTLGAKTDAYLNRIGVFGNDRTAFAEELRQMSRNSREIINNVAGNHFTPAEMKKSFSELDRTINTTANAFSAVGFKKELTSRNNRIKQFKNDVTASFESIKTHIDYFKQDAQRRNLGAGGHKEYRELVEAMKIADKDISQMKPEEVFNAYARLLSANEAYTEAHSGMTSGNIGRGRERFNHSKAMRDDMIASLGKVAKSYYSLQQFDNNHTLAQQTERNNNLIADYERAANFESEKTRQAEYESQFIDKFKPKTWLNKLSERAPDNNKPQNEAKANELYDNITKDIASMIAARQLEKLVVNSKMTKEDQKAFPFNDYVDAIRKSEAFVRMITPPQNGDRWAHIMDIKQSALQNDGKDIHAKYMNTASSLANANLKNNNAARKAPVINNQVENPQRTHFDLTFNK